MKKFSIIILALILAFSVCMLIACQPDEPADNDPKNYIDLRSDKEQKLDVGKSMKFVVYGYVDGKRVNNGITFVSSDTSVVEVDTFGNVTAVGGGTATVTLTLTEDPTVSEVVTFTVNKTAFMLTPGYSKGNVDLTTADTKGWVIINPGDQAQILAADLGENWYFACTLEHTGDTGGDSSGRWGVGSFLVNETTPIGDVMAWFGLKPTSHATKTYTPYVGGWRVQSSNNDPEIEICPAIANSNVADFEIIRYGADLYCKITVGDTVAKYVYSCPSLAGKPTYPGVYSQAQEVIVSNISSTSVMSQVMAKLQAFQTAEDVVIEGMGDSLFAGDTYNLTATVLPDTTFDKGVKFAIKQAVTGVTVSEAGVVTIAADATGSFTVVVTCDSDNTVTTEKTYAIKAKGTSESDLVDTTNVVGGASVDGDAITYATAETTLMPLAVGDAEKYAVSFNSTLTAGKIGFVYATKGYCNYFTAVIDANKLTYGLLGGEQTVIACKTNATNEITIIRDGDYFLFVVNGKLVNRVKIELANGVIPAIYGDGAVGAIASLQVVTADADVQAIIDTYPHTVGAYVTDNGDGSYTIAGKNFGNANDINWPPVNNYENGLKFETLTGDFTLEFKMGNITPMDLGNGKVDAKVLVYIRSEKTTASLQFVFKKAAGETDIKTTFCPNLNDATWIEYDKPALKLIDDNPITVKVVKSGDKVDLWLNGTHVFEDNSGMMNNGYWTDSTPCTPGIGTYLCGVTISDITLTTSTAE